MGNPIFVVTMAKTESLRKHKPTLLKWSLMLVMITIMMARPTQGVCIEKERKTLLEIKFSLLNSYDSKWDHILPTWIDYGNDLKDGGGGPIECCDWERVKCNNTTGHVIELSLYNLKELPLFTVYGPIEKIWPLNVSLFLHFEELRTLNLSFNFLDGRTLNEELQRLSSLKKLEILDLSMNSNIDKNIIPSLSAFTSLVTLDISDTGLEGDLPVNEFAALKNLKMLDVSNCGFDGTFQIQELARMTNLEELDLSWNNYFNIPSIEDCTSLSRLKKLERISFGYNYYGINMSIMSCLSSLPSLKILDLSGNSRPDNSFQIHELARMTNLEELHLNGNNFSIPSIEDCKSLSRLKRLERISFGYYCEINMSTMSCLSSLPSLKILDLSGSLCSENSLQIHELSTLRELETLDLSNNGLESQILKDLTKFSHLKVLLLKENRFNGTIPMEVFASFKHLEVLDLSDNEFVGSIPSTIATLSSLRALSLAHNMLNGSLSGLCELKNLYELDLSYNMFHGKLPQCFNNMLSLKVLDISSNQFSGVILPSLISNLKSLEYIDFSHNKFEGTFLISSFSNHTKLEAVIFISDNDNFEVETEEPNGWIPMFQLRVLVMSNCNMNRATESVVPSFLLYQHKLQDIDLSHNSLKGQFPNWIMRNNTMLKRLQLRNNSFGGNISIPKYRNAYTRTLDVAGNCLSGTIPADLGNRLPYVSYLNLSSNTLSGGIPSSIWGLGVLIILDLSDNELSGEVPKEVFTSLSESLSLLKLSNNRLHGEILSGNLSLGITTLYLDNNSFTGKVGDASKSYFNVLDISDNFFTGTIPSWMSNISFDEFLVKNNMFEGQFPCGRGSASYGFLDISQNDFSSSIPSCFGLQNVKHLHLGSNRFTGLIPDSFRNLTNVLTLDISHNSLSSKIPNFLGELSNLRILLLRKNNFSGPIPKQLCQLRNVNYIDLSGNSLSGPVPPCLQNMVGPINHVFGQQFIYSMWIADFYKYKSTLYLKLNHNTDFERFEEQDEVEYTTKAFSHPYKGNILNYMSGLDLSCNKLTGEIPKELGLLIHIHTLNLSHNQLIGPIPLSFSNFTQIESLDLSSNRLTGSIPSDLIKLNFLVVFNVSHNNLSGRLPAFNAQFGTFTNKSYEGNPLLCGTPLGKCINTSYMTKPSNEEEEEGSEKWYDMDMSYFYISFSSTLVVFMLGIATILYINPEWRRRWLDLVEGCMYTCYYFLYDSVRKISMTF